MSHHACQEDSKVDQMNKPTVPEREKRRNNDNKPGDDSVKHVDKGAASGSYAYHEVDANGDALCNPGKSKTVLETITRSEAKRLGKSPCQMCSRIEQYI
jgi:hypothetical protein